MTNTLKLKAVLVEKGFTNKSIAKKLGISTQCFSMKINNKREFKITEILNMARILSIFNMDEFVSIFFTNKVELNSTQNV